MVVSGSAGWVGGWVGLMCGYVRYMGGQMMFGSALYVIMQGVACV